MRKKTKEIMGKTKENEKKKIEITTRKEKENCEEKLQK